MHTVEKALEDAGRQGLRARSKKAANEAIAAVKTAMAGDDKDDIERKTQALEQASTALMQKMYEQQQAGGAAAARARAAPGGGAQRRQEGRRARCRVRRGQGKRPQEGLRRRLRRSRSMRVNRRCMRTGGSFYGVERVRCDRRSV